MRRRTSERLKRLAPDIKREVGSVLFAAGELLATEAQVSITSGSASGTSGGRHQHVPSRPGEPPHNFTGTLASNIEVTQPEQLLVKVTSHAPYSKHLEYGTSRMAARPFMGPAAQATKRDIKKLVAKATSRAFRRSRGRA